MVKGIDDGVGRLCAAAGSFTRMQVAGSIHGTEDTIESGSGLGKQVGDEWNSHRLCLPSDQPSTATVLLL